MNEKLIVKKKETFSKKNCIAITTSQSARVWNRIQIFDASASTYQYYNQKQKSKKEIEIQKKKYLQEKKPST